MNVQTVTSLDIPELAPYRTLRRPVEHYRRGIFVAEGELVVRRLFQSPLTVLSVLMTPEWFEQHERENLWPSQGSLTVYLANQKLLETIVGYRLHQGVMAVARVPASCSLDEVVSFREGVIVALDGMVSAENVGVIVRNCAAFGARALLVDETTSSPYLRRAVRNSMGGVFRIPIVQLPDLAPALRTLAQRHRFRIIGADPNGRKGIKGYDFSGNICLVFGNEGTGLSKQSLAICTETVSIPMDNDTDSLNVAVASAVFLYEAKHGGARSHDEFK